MNNGISRQKNAEYHCTFSLFLFALLEELVHLSDGVCPVAFQKVTKHTLKYILLYPSV